MIIPPGIKIACIIYLRNTQPASYTHAVEKADKIKYLNMTVVLLYIELCKLKTELCSLKTL